MPGSTVVAWPVHPGEPPSMRTAAGVLAGGGELAAWHDVLRCAAGQQAPLSCASRLRRPAVPSAATTNCLPCCWCGPCALPSRSSGVPGGPHPYAPLFAGMLGEHAPRRARSSPCSTCIALFINLAEHEPSWRRQLRALQLPDPAAGGGAGARVQLVPLLCALLAQVATPAGAKPFDGHLQGEAAPGRAAGRPSPAGVCSAWPLPSAHGWWQPACPVAPCPATAALPWRSRDRAACCVQAV